MGKGSRRLLETADLFAFYENQPEIYELLSQAEDIDNKILKTVLRDVSFADRTLLDVGAGTGRFSVPLSSVARSLCSLDVSRGALEILRGKSRQACAVQASYGKMPFPSGTFDVVLSSWGLKLDVGFGEVVRVTKEGGLIVLIENDVDGEYQRLKRRFLLNDNTYARYFSGFLLARGFKRKVFTVKVDLRSKENVEKVFSGEPPLEGIKRYLNERGRTWFGLGVAVFYKRKD